MSNGSQDSRAMGGQQKWSREEKATGRVSEEKKKVRIDTGLDPQIRYGSDFAGNADPGSSLKGKMKLQTPTFSNWM
jgi:hypothetical protein